MYELMRSGAFNAILGAATWAVGVILFRKGGETVPPLALNFFKNTIGLACFLLSLWILGIPLFPAERSLEDWSILLLSGVLGIAVADSLFFASLNRLGAGRSAIVDCLYSPFILFCSFLFLDEPMGVWLLMAVVLVVIAVLLGAWEAEPAAVPKPRLELILGIGYGVVAIWLMAAAIVLAKPVLNRADPWWTTTVRLLGGVGMLVAQGVLPEHRQEILRCFRPGPTWRITVPSALVGTYLAMLFWIRGMTFTHTTTASILSQLSTLFVLALATIFLKEPLTLRRVIAILLGIAGAMAALRI